MTIYLNLESKTKFIHGVLIQAAFIYHFLRPSRAGDTQHERWRCYRAMISTDIIISSVSLSHRLRRRFNGWKKVYSHECHLLPGRQPLRSICPTELLGSVSMWERSRWRSIEFDWQSYHSRNRQPVSQPPPPLRPYRRFFWNLLIWYHKTRRLLHSGSIRESRLYGIWVSFQISNGKNYTVPSVDMRWDSRLIGVSVFSAPPFLKTLERASHFVSGWNLETAILPLSIFGPVVFFDSHVRCRSWRMTVLRSRSILPEGHAFWWRSIRDGKKQGSLNAMNRGIVDIGLDRFR